MVDYPHSRKIIGKIVKRNKDSIDFQITIETSYCDIGLINIPNFLIYKAKIISEGLYELIVADWFLEKKLAILT
jgi:hypothetical protein